MEEDYKVVIPLTGGEGTLGAESGRSPVYNFSPTSRWQPGEVVVDRYQVDIPPDIPPGTHSLSTGMYLLETMEDLPVIARDGTLQGNTILLSSIQVR